METEAPIVATVKRLAALGARLDRDHAPRRLRMRVLDVMTKLEGQLPLDVFDAARLAGEASPFQGAIEGELSFLGIVRRAEEPTPDRRLRAVPEGPPACLRSVARRIPR